METQFLHDGIYLRESLQSMLDGKTQQNCKLKVSPNGDHDEDNRML